MNKPYSEACDQNRDPILHVIGPILQQRRKLLEIGSGTGQHAVYFAGKLPHLDWITSDQADYLAGIRLWLDDAGLPNTHGPVELDVRRSRWPRLDIDAVFSANTTHIMHWPAVVALFAGVGAALPPGGDFLLYGPFNYGGSYTSDSNARFDQMLQARDPHSGIRDFESLQTLAGDNALALVEDYAMPANNRILHWRKNS